MVYLLETEHVCFCLCDYVACYIIVALVIYTLSGEFWALFRNVDCWQRVRDIQQSQKLISSLWLRKAKSVITNGWVDERRQTESIRLTQLFFELNFFLKKWVRPGNTTIKNCRPTHSTMRKRHRAQTAITQSKATSSLFLSKMIAKLESQPRTYTKWKKSISNAY